MIVTWFIANCAINQYRAYCIRPKIYFNPFLPEIELDIAILVSQYANRFTTGWRPFKARSASYMLEKNRGDPFPVVFYFLSLYCIGLIIIAIIILNSKFFSSHMWHILVQLYLSLCKVDTNVNKFRIMYPSWNFFTSILNKLTKTINTKISVTKTVNSLYIHMRMYVCFIYILCTCIIFLNTLLNLLITATVKYLSFRKCLNNLVCNYILLI